ncbi:high affinity 3',5'-cyclic-AMP phosphodiesterase 7A-like [Tachypleus tridentatus]|uniref:high affinity 3',5'-cyclic-AMP phosphodiesterase 7A-like n=1 Tax=Tachypleus tridentatus TaxID=6853 RepID=UPI003FD152CC
MIPFATCVCTKEKQNTQKWLGRTTLGQTKVETEKAQDGSYCIRLSASIAKPTSTTDTIKKPPKLSDEDTNLLASLTVSGQQCHQALRTFRTLQRHRIHCCVTKPEIQHLDVVDSSNGGVIQYLLAACWKWNFSVFSLDVATGGRSVSVLLLHLFHEYGLIKEFRLDALKILHCFTLVENGYHRDNPYHNAVHAADVTQALHCFLQEKTISKQLTSLETMASLIAAVGHDLDHPGFNQPFLIATSNHLALLYKNFSVLETHHWRMAVSCLRESRLFDHLEKEVCVKIESWMQSMILATDISRQQDFLEKLKKFTDEGSLDMSKQEKRHFVLQVALKCADLCNPCRPWSISKQWSYQVCEELFQQGDIETELSLPITPVCDRTKTSVARIQTDFLRFVVTPLFVMWHKFLSSPLSHELMQHLHHNQIKWDELLQHELEQLDEMSSVSEEAAMNDYAQLALEKDNFSTSLKKGLIADSLMMSMRRRNSMPMKSTTLVPKTSFRRQSFPRILVSQSKDLPSGCIPLQSQNYSSSSSEVTASSFLENRTSIVSLTNEFNFITPYRLEDEVVSDQLDILQKTTYGSLPTRI